MTASADAIRTMGLAKSYGDVRAVDGLSLRVGVGETVAVLGPNGAGKTTTVSMLLGLQRPDAGTIEIRGASPQHAVADGRVGAMLQDARLPAYATVGESLALARAIYPRPLPTEDVVATAGLGELLDRRVDVLSGGEVQRARFGFALAGDPDLLVLDEPTAGMDVEARQRFWSGVGRRADAGGTVLFATHYLAEAEEFADRIVILAGGCLVADGSRQEITRATGRPTLTDAYLALTRKEETA